MKQTVEYWGPRGLFIMACWLLTAILRAYDLHNLWVSFPDFVGTFAFGWWWAHAKIIKQSVEV